MVHQAVLCQGILLCNRGRWMGNRGRWEMGGIDSEGKMNNTRVILGGRTGYGIIMSFSLVNDTIAWAFFS